MRSFSVAKRSAGRPPNSPYIPHGQELRPHSSLTPTRLPSTIAKAAATVDKSRPQRLALMAGWPDDVYPAIDTPEIAR